jgi:hypothetical protein
MLICLRALFLTIVLATSSVNLQEAFQSSNDVPSLTIINPSSCPTN